MTTPRSNQFSLAAAILGTMARTFRRIESVESVWVKQIESKEPLLASSGDRAFRVPDAAFLGERDMAVGASGHGGAYLVDQNIGGIALALQPHSVALAAGADVVRVVGGDIALARGTGGAAAYWLPDEFTPLTETSPTFSQVTSTPKFVGAFVKVSRQLLLQSNADAVLRQLLLATIGTAVDKAVLQGTGAGGQPQGIVGTSGVGTVSGASLGLAGIIEFESDVNVNNAGGDPTRCAFVTTAATAALLKQRPRNGTGSPTLWTGPLARGEIEGQKSFATENCPAATMVYGDWSYVKLVQWGTATIDVDESSNFKSGIVGLRILLPLDIVVVHPAAFSVATSVT